MRTRTTLAVAVAAVVLPAGTASAAPPWSDPVDLGPGTGRIDEPQLGFAAAGTPQFTYSFTTPEAPALEDTRSAFARRRPGGTVVRDVLRDDMVAQARFGRRSWALLRYRGPRGRGRALLRVSIGTGPGRLGEPWTLARYWAPDYAGASIYGSSLPRIASGPDGSIAILWTEVAERRRNGTFGARIRLVHRRPGGRFSRPITVATQAPTGSLRNARLAFHGLRAVTVAYARNRTVEARILRLGGRALKPQTLGRAPESYTDLRVATSPGGRTVVAWGNAHGTEMGAESRYSVRAALRAPGARRFTAAQTLDRGVVQVGAPGEVGAIVADDGTATVGWSAYTSSRLFTPAEVRVATAAPGRRFAAPQVLAADGRLADLELGKDGAALAVWISPDPSGVTVNAALRRAGARTFAAPETVTAIPLRSFSPQGPDPDAAYDARTNRFAVIWAIDSTAGALPVPGSARLLLATRNLRAHNH